MTTVPAPSSSRRRYVVAAVLVVLAVAIGAVFGVVVARAISGYDITPVRAGDQATVTVGERKLAVWVSPENPTVSCRAVETGTQRESFATTSSTTMTITDGGRTWSRLGLIDGEPGSTHALTCTDVGGVIVGTADNPRVLRYLVIGGALGATALLLMISAFVLALLTALRSRAARR